MRSEEAPSCAETLSPTRASELLRRQDALQAEAAVVLADLDLFSLLSRVGAVSQAGSSATGLMVWRDIDVAGGQPAAWTIRCCTWHDPWATDAGHL